MVERIKKKKLLQVILRERGKTRQTYNEIYFCQNNVWMMGFKGMILGKSKQLKYLNNRITTSFKTTPWYVGVV